MPKFKIPSDIPEPAHLMIPHLEDILRELYKYIRDKYQPVINQTFDSVAKDIGFVVSTTVPMNIEIGDGGVVKNFAVSKNSPMKGTLMDRALAKSLKPLLGAQTQVKTPGVYEFFVIWPDALKYKLNFDWYEPAHLKIPGIDLSKTVLKRPAETSMKMVWESHEPAHWFDPKVTLTDAESMHIALLDETYPELRLMERIKQVRHG